MSDEIRLDIFETIEKAEEIHAEKMTPEIKTTPGIHDQAGVPTKDILGVAGDKELLDELSVEESKKGDGKDEQEKPRTKIQKVPEIMLRNHGNYEEYYKPRSLSIGPVYAKSSVLVKKELKVKLAARFVEKRKKPREMLLKGIKTRISDLKQYFDEAVIESYSDDSLARLLFLDGCSILQFIHSYVFKELKDFKLNNGQAELIRRDLFLVENQIPFPVLKLLMSEGDLDLTICIIDFVLMNNIMVMVDDKILVQVAKLIHSGPVHLLDLLRSVLLIDDTGAGENNDDARRNPFFHGEQKPSFSGDAKAFLREMYDNDTRYSFHNVQELKSSGISMKRSNSSLTAVSFASKCYITGQLKVPPLIVDDSTACKLLNLAAYELCLENYESNSVVTSYIKLLDLLIDSEQDVKEMRVADVLRNRVSSDAEVAELLNHVGSSCLAPPQDNYLGVKRQIQQHFKKRWAVWMTQVYHNHFSSPLAILGVLGALVILLLTAIQTWYATHPVG